MLHPLIYVNEATNFKSDLTSYAMRNINRVAHTMECLQSHFRKVNLCILYGYDRETGSLLIADLPDQHVVFIETLTLIYVEK